MSRLTLAKIITGILLALSIGLGLFQHNRDPYLGSNKTSYNFVATDKSLEGYYNEAAEMAKNSDSRTELSFLAVGDIMLSRNVATQIEKQKDVNYPFLALEDILKSTDFNFGNLESPFYKTSKNCLTGEAVGIIGGHSLIFGAPCLYVKGLRDYNFQILNLANNHALDQGLSGLNFTTSLLSDPNVAIQSTGVGENLKEAWKPTVVETKGIKICFIGASYASINDGGKAINNYVARIEDVENLKLSIENAKLLCDFTVTTMHAGIEYVRKPNQAQIDFAHTAIDAGADMVIGSHSHWIQTIERYCPQSSTSSDSPSTIHGEGAGGEVKCNNPKYIFYSLGNFIFDQMWSQDTREGLTIKITLSKTGCSPSPLARGDALSASEGQRGCTDNLQGNRQPAKLESIKLIPIIIENYSTPRPANEIESKKILEKIDETSTILQP